MTRTGFLLLSAFIATPALAQGPSSDEHEAAVLMGKAHAAAAQHNCELATKLRDEAMARGARGARLDECDPAPIASAAPLPVPSPTQSVGTVPPTVDAQAPSTAIDEQEAAEHPVGVAFSLTAEQTAGFGFLYFADPAYAVDLHLGVSVVSTTLGDANRTDWTITPQLGVRLYARHKGRVRVYGEPSFGLVLNQPVDMAGDHHATEILVAASLGVEYALAPGFTVGAQTGAAVSVLDGDAGDAGKVTVVQFGTATTGAYATIWW